MYYTQRCGFLFAQLTPSRESVFTLRGGWTFGTIFGVGVGAKVKSHNQSSSIFPTMSAYAGCRVRPIYHALCVSN